MKRRLACVGAVSALGAMMLVAPSAAGAAENSADSQYRAEPKVLSASWGTDNGVSCPNGVKGLDNLPVTFNWFIKRSSIQNKDFTIVRSDGSTVHPTCSLQFPPNEKDEAQTVNLIGNFGDSVNGPVPVKVKVSDKLQGKAPGTDRWYYVGKLPAIKVNKLSGGPFITDAWRLTNKLYKHDRNRCTVGSYFVRVMWSNGLTAYPTGQEVGSAVTNSYRAVFKLKNGKKRAFKPLAVADLHDHSSAANADNMHDLCLSGVPKKATLKRIKIGSKLIQDPNGDPNKAQNFQVR